MADSVLERITQHIETTLKSVRKTNGYQSDFTVVRRGWQGNAPTTEGVFVVIHQGQPTKIENQSHDQTGWDQPYGIELYVYPAEDQELIPDAAINSARADAEKALTYDRESRKRDGLAFDTMVQAPLLFQDGSNHGVEVRIVVRYFTKFNDPMTSAYES